MKIYIQPLINKVSKEKSDTPIIISQFQFWEYYIRLYLMQKNLKLNYLEYEVFKRLLMSSNTTVSLFNKVNRTQIQGDLNISSVRLSQTTKSLKEKGLIVKNGKRGEYVLNKRLKEFVDYMNSMFKERGSLDIEFNFNFMVKWLEK